MKTKYSENHVWHSYKRSLITDLNSGEVVCSCCGMVVEETTHYMGYEHRLITPEDFNNHSMTGSKTSLTIPDKGLDTVIHSFNRDSSGKRLQSNSVSLYKRLRRLDKRNKSENKMAKPLLQLDGLKAKLGLSDTLTNHTAYLFRKIKKIKSRSGISSNLLIAACVYASCRIYGVPRTLQDVAAAADEKKKRLQMTYRDLSWSLDLKLNTYDSVDFLSKISSQVKAKKKTKIDAIRILRKAQDMKIFDGKNPVGIAASSLYYASIINDERLPQRTIASAAGISHVTIKKGYEILTKKILRYENYKD